MSDETATPWPAVLVEARSWTTNPDQRGPAGARPGLRERLLTEISVEIPQPIAGRSVPLASATTAACEEAAHRIASLEARAAHLGGLVELLVRTEAVASSKIEHIYADLDEIARATIGHDAGERARRTIAAGKALTALTASCDDGRPLSERAILDAHAALMEGDPVEGRWAGRLREQQNWIGGSDFSPLGAVHVPPPWEQVGPLLADLVAFARRDDLPSVAQAAVVHAQFEAIHPFTDGNGRIGRGLIGGVLRHRGVTRSVTLPVAAAMLSDVDRYFDRLRDYRAGDPDAITAYVAESAIAAAEASIDSADHLAALPVRWHEAARARRGSSAYTLIERLLTTPIMDIATAEIATGTSRVRTYEAIDRLASAGILHEITAAGRNRIWVASEVMTELDELERRIGVRSVPSRRWLRGT